MILTTFELDEYVFEALQAGASGFLIKNAPPEELLRVRPTGGGPRWPCRWRGRAPRLLRPQRACGVATWSDGAFLSLSRRRRAPAPTR